MISKFIKYTLTLSLTFMFSGCGMTSMFCAVVDSSLKAGIASLDRPEFPIEKNYKTGDIFIAVEDLRLSNDCISPITQPHQRKYNDILKKGTKFELTTLSSYTRSNFPRGGSSHGVDVKLKILTGKFKNKKVYLYDLNNEYTIGYSQYLKKTILKKQ